MTPEERVDLCSRVRQKAADAVTEVLKNARHPSEEDVSIALWKEIEKSPELYGQGWYDPPPGGSAALFAPSASPERLLFDTLRKEEFWPSPNFTLGEDSVGFVYLSPVHRATGTIGDFAVTVYTGTNEKILSHIQRGLDIVEKVASYAEEGMELRGMHEFAQKILAEEGLSNKRTLTYTDTIGTNIGHTIPWTYEDPTPEERAIIDGGDFDALKNLISKKRINVNREERFRIPETAAFTVELRIEDPSDPALPNVYYHLIVSFKNRVKTVFGNFNGVFEGMGINRYLVSSF